MQFGGRHSFRYAEVTQVPRRPIPIYPGRQASGGVLPATYTKCPHGVSTVFRLGPGPVVRLFLHTPEAENRRKQRSSPSTEDIFYFYSFSGDAQHWKLKTCHSRPSSPSPADITLVLPFPRVVHISTTAPTAQRARAKECYVQTARLTPTSARKRMLCTNGKTDVLPRA